MRYEHFEQLDTLRKAGMITARPHPTLPLTIYNYSAKAQHTPLTEWTEPMKDCRGLILDNEGEIVGRPFRKFWNYEQVLDQIPNEPFVVWEKLDGSLGIVCSYAGERVVATRGSFGSEQAKWFARWLNTAHPNFMPSGETWLFEVIYPANRIVVDYGDRKEAVLLAVMSPDGVDIQILLNACTRFKKADKLGLMSQAFELEDLVQVNSDPQFANQEGFVLQFKSGFRCKVKLAEYKRLHRLITQVSTRVIWELLRSGKGVDELLDRVPDDFKQWVLECVKHLTDDFAKVKSSALSDFGFTCGLTDTRKSFAARAVRHQHPNLLFTLYDGKNITDNVWRIVEPDWATPFRKDNDI